MALLGIQILLYQILLYGDASLVGHWSKVVLLKHHFFVVSAFDSGFTGNKHLDWVCTKFRDGE